MNRLRTWTLYLLTIVVVTICGCAGVAGNAPPVLMVTVSPNAVSVRAGDSQGFTITVTGTTNTSVTWEVNGIAGGGAASGTISSAGLYQAPPILPSPNTVTVQAVSAANPSVQGTSAVTLLNPIPVVSSINPVQIGVGAFLLTVTGSQFVSGSQVMFGGTALTTTFVSSTQLTATGTATASQMGAVTITVRNPDPGAIVSTTSQTAQVVSSVAVTPAAAARFLEESTFGPTPALITQLQQAGFINFLSAQFNAPASTYPDPAPTVNTLVPTQQVFFTNAMTGPDQLRQRVAFALSEIWVVSGNTIPPQGMAPYMRLLTQDAFTNYRTLMEDVTLSPAMGRYLDMVNNDKPNAALNTHANENYARELLQLFTLGLFLENQDGMLKLDANHNPIPTYGQNEIQQFARVYTGWTFPTMPGNSLQTHNPQYFLGPMVPVEGNHDMTAKTLLQGLMLPAGQTAELDLAGALDNIFNHPNIAPFVSAQLIQHLVTSNPSAAYIKRVADVFASGTFQGIGSGKRGDMEALVAAILLDPEARRGDTPATANPLDGHLREPILLITNLLRAFGGVTDGNSPVNFTSSMNQPPLRAPSVFNFFPPNFLIPGTALLGPEFDIQNTATSLVRINFINTFAFGNLGAGTTVDFTTYANMASNPGQMVDALNALLLHGTMSAADKAAILTAVNAVPAGAAQQMTQAKTAIYLIASSSQYQVMH